MACALSHGHHWCEDREYYLALLSYRYDLDGGELAKAVGEIPEPVLTKEAGFVDPLLEDLVGYTVALYERWLAKLPKLAYKDPDIGQTVVRAHQVLSQRVIQPAVRHAFNAGRVGALEQDREILKAVQQLDLFVPPKPKQLQLELEELDKEIERLEREHPLDPWDKHALEYAKRRAASYCRGLGNRLGTNLETLAIETERQVRQDLMRRIRREVSEAIVRRDTARRLASSIGRSTGDWSRNLDRIARTELQFAHQNGWAAHFRATTGDDTLVAKRVDDDACDDCKRLLLEPDGRPKVFVLEELEANGTNVGKKRDAWDPTTGPIHPYCFPPGTMVQTVAGLRAIERVVPGEMVWRSDGELDRVSAVWTTRHDEPVDLVTLSGVGWELRCTAEHEVLTPSGWLAAKLLKPGHDVLREAIDVDRPLRPDSEPDHDPSLGLQEGRFACILSGFSFRGVPVSAVYFNGELHVGEGDVYQEAVDLIAWNRIDTKKLKGLHDNSFVVRCDPVGVSGGSFLDVLGRLRCPTDSIVGRSDDRVAFILGQLGPSSRLSSGASSLFKPQRLDSVNDGPAGDTERIGYVFHRAHFVEMHPDNVGGVHVLSEACHVSSMVTDIHSMPYRGDLHNLTVGFGGESYIANGVGVHNCHCQIIRVPAGFVFDAEGRMIPGRAA
jgi:hypothetical protein